jgi:ketosteroid isomerase-like protein
MYPPAVGGVQSFDQSLLALNTPQCQVSVAGGCGELGASVHRLSLKPGTGVSGLVRIVSAMTDASDTAHEFFERYAAALLARDEKAMAGMYAVPALILFPGMSIPVSDASQTEEFFASSWDQYAGVDAVDKQIVVMGEAPGSLWVDVTWSYDGKARERFCYQLVAGTDGYQIAVLTPMA